MQLQSRAKPPPGSVYSALTFNHGAIRHIVLSDISEHHFQKAGVVSSISRSNTIIIKNERPKGIEWLIWVRIPDTFQQNPIFVPRNSFQSCSFVLLASS